MATSRGKPRPKAYLSIGEYLRKAGAFKTVNVYYNEIISTHPSVALSDNGDDEEVDHLAEGMIDAAQYGHLETLRSLATKTQTEDEEGGIGICIGERASSLMLHLAAEYGHEAIVRYLVEELWVDVDAATVRGMTALHYAAKANRTAVIRELSRLGADLEARNDSGQVPAHLAKDRLLRRLFQQYLGGAGSLGGAGPMIDRFVPPAASRLVDYIVVMTVKLAPQLEAESDQLSEVKQVSACEMWRFPAEDHADAPMGDASNLAEICTQTCEGESGPLPPYGTLLTDMSGARSYVWSKVLGVYQTVAQKGRARVMTTLVTPSDASSVAAGEVTARVVMVLARRPYTAAYAAICDHLAELFLDEAPKWGSLAEWPLDMENERNAQIKFAAEYYATELPLPLPSRLANVEVLGRRFEYGDAHASHSSLPHLEESDLACLMSRLGPDTILLALSCLLQEQSVLILSDRIEDLAPVTSALLGLLFPLRWPHTVIPVLPASLVHYLEAPVPFLMGMDQRGLDRVGADLSCLTMVNLSTNKVVLPIRPITSVTTVMVTVRASDNGGKEPARRASRRDSGMRSLAELPMALKRRTENRLRRCVPLDTAPASDRRHHQPRASALYTPGLRVTVADVMVELFGAHQTYRYVEGAQKRVVAEAPEDHRKMLEAIFSTQLWNIFRHDVRAEEGGGGATGGECWEEQAQLFCACVERARHSGRGTAAATPGESNSCQDVLYPSEDVEQQLALLSVYPEPDSIPDDLDDDYGGGSGEDEAHSDSPLREAGTPLAKLRESSREGSNVSGAGSAIASGASEINFQEKTDEMLKSITTSFSAMTDIFGGKNKTPPPPQPAAGTDDVSGASVRHCRSSSDHGRVGPVDAGRGGGGWDLFKPPSVAGLKKRLEGIAVVGAPDSPTPSKTRVAVLSEKDSGKRAGGSSLSPPAQARQGSGLAKIGESWRDLRRRSAGAMSDAVTKFRSTMDDGDAAGTATTPSGASGGEKVEIAAAKARSDDDAFWNPFGGVEGEEGGALDEPVPLPTAEEVRRGRDAKEAKNRVASSSRAQLMAYYGGGDA